MLKARINLPASEHCMDCGDFLEIWLGLRCSRMVGIPANILEYCC